MRSIVGIDMLQPMPNIPLGAFDEYDSVKSGVTPAKPEGARTGTD